jgi:hypothetical protein
MGKKKHEEIVLDRLVIRQQCGQKCDNDWVGFGTKVPTRQPATSKQRVDLILQVVESPTVTDSGPRQVSAPARVMARCVVGGNALTQQTLQ